MRDDREHDIANLVLDSMRSFLLVLDGEGVVVYANGPARQVMGAGTQPPAAKPWTKVAALGEAVRGDGRERRGVRWEGESHADSWTAHAWPLGGGRVVVQLHCQHDSDGPVAAVASALTIEPTEARLALYVVQGLSNLNISTRINVSEGSVKTRLWRLYRKLGVGTRAELAALVAHHVPDLPID